MKLLSPVLSFSVQKTLFNQVQKTIQKNLHVFLAVFLSLVSVAAFLFFYYTKVGLAYNDARSHLDIGRRVVEGLKPGLAQLGSVWLPLPHLLMIPTIWNDFMWHSGLSGAIESMISFVATGMLIYFFLRKIGIGFFASTVAVLIFATNINILYLQSTAMTELLLLGTMTAGVYYLLRWEESKSVLDLVKTAFWIMLSTLNRYDGWFLLGFTVLLVIILSIKKGYKTMEGTALLFITLAGIGIGLWFLWNLLIFKDPLYFIFGPYSAHAQQQQLASAGVLASKKNLLLSTKIYYYALAFNSGMFILLLSTVGAVVFFFDKKISPGIKIVTSALFAPLLFNILALYLGFSVLFVQGISGSSWFNVRYGIMMIPSIAIFIGYLFQKSGKFKWVILGLLLLVTYYSFNSVDAVTIDDARVGSSQKNVTEVSGWLNVHAKNTPGFVLISAASHDAIIFSSGLPMSKFIHEGTGAYWLSATSTPDRWARWIIMRTHDNNDQTWKLVSKTPGFARYNLVGKYPFADIYQIKPEYVRDLHVQPLLGRQK